MRGLSTLAPAMTFAASVPSVAMILVYGLPYYRRMEKMFPDVV
jgi:hypothetical protein